MNTSTEQLIVTTKIVNIVFTSIATIIGLFGNCILLNVFTQRKYRINSYTIYLMCLALNNSLFLFIHLIEVNLYLQIKMYRVLKGSYLN